MATVLGNLKELHQLLNELADIRDQLERGPLQLKARQSDLSEKVQSLQTLRDHAKRLRIDADQKELGLKSSEARVKDLKLKLNLVKTNKEFGALQDEIRNLQQGNDKIEEEVLAIITEQEAEVNKIKQAEQQLRNETQECDKFKEVLGYRMEKFQRRVELLQQQIVEFENRLEPATMIEYRRLVKLKGRMALAACEDGTCSACFIGQTPQACNELALGKVVYCHACGAMLYSA